MELTPEVKQLFRGFHQGMEYCASGPEDIAMNALGFLKPEHVHGVKVFLDELLSGRYSADQIQEVWHTTPADLYFHDPNDAVKVLELVRSFIDTHPFLSASK